MSEQKITILQLKDNPNFCLTAKSISNGSAIILYHQTGTGSARQRWILDEDNGIIRLASNPDLAISFNSNHQPLYLSEYIPGRINQQWDWSNTNGTIISQTYPNCAIDNYTGSEMDNNPIYLWDLNQSIAQQWIQFQLNETQAKVPALML